ncbi:hypothetical protein M378DRAFT_173842 [Amanita muscaria Koide BX008]|uniref:Uncharacterized protein n=1 Tax=Amanita muscaria (strain Koide BX008) TaxID=946122 RepID=A0A0C2SMC1_AMAMK|nr:hypothetical protein M378DRAFT_173842 [Amanita muscaria Koide BX008]
MSQAHSVFCKELPWLSYENARGFLKVFSPIYISIKLIRTKSGIRSNAVHEDLQWSLGWKSYIKHLVRDVGNVLRV